MRAIIQSTNTDEITTLHLNISAPDIIVYLGVYYKKVYLHKLGDCIYRPASIHMESTRPPKGFTHKEWETVEKTFPNK